MNKHTKRSEQFRARMDTLIHKLHLALGPGHELAVEVQQVLMENTTDSGCLVGAAEDEPVFVLRAKDKLMPYAINYWCNTAKEMGLHADKVEDAADAGLEAVEWRLVNRKGE